jgi:dihydropteroate synthase
VVRDELVRRGFDPARADTVARGLEPVGLVIDPMPPEDREKLAVAAGEQGVDILTGEDWAIMAGGAARLAGLARPGSHAVPQDVANAMGLLLRGFMEVPDAWVTARGTVALDGPCVVGILNVTPDSFSDGGRYSNLDDAVRHAETMVQTGAQIIDIGGESTRPGKTQSLSAGEEWTRLGPVLREVVRRFPTVPVSVDTVKADTARRALDTGAWIVNDVSGLRHDPEIASLCADHGAGLVLMHSRGDLGDLASYRHAHYADVAATVMDELLSSVATAESRGLARGHIVLDPGLGFSKEPHHNYAVLNRLGGLAALGLPVMVGPSRKRFLGHTIDKEVGARDNATVAACVAGFLSGARLFRVHAVEPVVEALAVVSAIQGA